MPEEINNKQNIQIARLEGKVDGLGNKVDRNSEKIDSVLINHFPTLTKQIATIEANQKILLAVLMMVVAGLISLIFS